MNLQRLAASLTIALTLSHSPAALAAADTTVPGPAPASGNDTYDPTRPAPVAPKPDGPKADVPKPDAPKADAPRVDVPKGAAPTAPAPAAVVPDIQLPAASASPLPGIGPVPMPVPVPSDVRSFLWEVKSPTNTVWLFGTMHVGKREFYPLPDVVETAFGKSATLVVEADISKPAVGEMNLLISYFPPDTLEKNIPKYIYDRLGTQLARLQIPEAAVKSMRPVVVGGFLSLVEFDRLGYDMELGVDGYLLRRAKVTGKPVEELESVRAQLEMLGNMPEDLQEAFLDNAIATLELDRSADQVNGMVTAWRTGDTKLMLEVTAAVNRDMKLTRQLDEILLYGRHDAMLKKIERYLAGKEPHFVAVGSLHLVGPRGLIQALKSKGYEVTQK
jgi:hypothetical protein